MRRLCVCILCCVLMLSMALTAYAAGNVTYYAEADEFVFAPGSNHSPTDLFSNLKGVMPGDTITDQIEIKNHSTKGAQIRLYLRSLGAQENTDAFLSQLTLTVKERDGSLLFDAPADQTAQLTDWVYLGTIKPLGKTKLDLELQVPHTLGNEFQNEIAYIDWEFKIEKIVPDDLNSKMMLNNYVGASFMYRKECALAVGEYREDLFLVEDYEFFIRMSFHSKMGHISQFLYYYMDNPNSLTATRQKEIRERLVRMRIMYLDKAEDAFTGNPQLLALVYYRIIDNLFGKEKLKYFIKFAKRLPIHFGIKYLFVHVPNAFFKKITR